MAKKVLTRKKARRAAIGPSLTESAAAVDSYLQGGDDKARSKWNALAREVKGASRASRRGLAPAGSSPRKKAARPPQKVRTTFHLPLALVNEARDTVVALAGPPERLTLAGLAETGLRKELERLRKRYNHGEAFPRRAGELKGGRPIGS